MLQVYIISNETTGIYLHVYKSLPRQQVCFSCVGPSTYHTYNFIILKINYNGPKTIYDIQKYEIISVYNTEYVYKRI